MRALLVNPLFPDTYWSQRHALPWVRRKCLIPPLGLITVAAMLPRHWSLELVDMNVEPLTDDAIARADVVMLTGMLAQRDSLHEVIGRCRAAGVPTVVGGPYATSLPEDFGKADHVVVGEAEELVADLAADLEAGRARRIYREARKPGLDITPVPRFDLLRPRAYHHMAVQFSRGCPFSCEFCDITSLFGHRPRTKTSAQVLAELEAIHATGFRGEVFFVDDNFIGNKKAVRELLPELARWREARGRPFTFYTEASMNLAQDDALIDAMTRAGFGAAFMGIETPSESALRETHKLQNTRFDLVTGVHRLLERGIDVWAGFIVGFDSEGRDIFDRMIRFVQNAAIPYAMVGVLHALPRTRLFERLTGEGRLIETPTDGDQFGLTNFVTKMDPVALLTGYRKVLETLYEPSVYFERCRRNLERWKPSRFGSRPRTLNEYGAALRSLLSQGRGAGYRRVYRSFLGWAATRHPSKLGRAIGQAIAGHHYIMYTRQTVIPRLERQIEELTRARATPRPAQISA
ncbi:MAG: DUF4070 domain-containing protein [Acidobacteria bacterium]|nr:MAG: DUF4070 domain-containing protein [Acidobacteriota bacterium]